MRFAGLLSLAIAACTCLGFAAAPMARAQDAVGSRRGTAALPAATQVSLKPDPALPALSEEQALGLAIAAAMNEPSWAACLSGRPGADDLPGVAARTGDPIPELDVSMGKYPGGYYRQVLVSGLTDEQAAGFKASRPSDVKGLEELAGAGAGIRYFGVDVRESAGGEESNSFFEGRSNEARYGGAQFSAAGYSIPMRDSSGTGAARNVQITTADGLFSQDNPPPVVVAFAERAKTKEGIVIGKGGDARSVAFAPVQCKSPQPAARR